MNRDVKFFIKKIFSSTSVFIFAAISSHAYADMGYMLHQIAQEKKEQQEYQLKTMMGLNDHEDFNPMFVAQSTFDQKIDHMNSNDTRTFKQRYFTQTQYGKNQNSPVFYYICGEAECNGISPNSTVVQQARKYGAYIVAIEHRYYGKSQPFSELTVENLQYLNTDEVIADLANFQTVIMKKNNWNGPWIAIGGSYAGALSAYYRLKHPELVVGALSSSGPVEAKLEFGEYDANTTLVAGPECRDAIREVTNYVSIMLNNQKEMNRIKKLFHVENMKNNLAMVFLLSEFATEAIQYGYRDSFCSELLATSDRLQGFANGSTEILSYLGMDGISFTAEGALSTKTSEYSSGVGVRQWFWQTCTEYAYFYTANSNPDLSTRSPLINLDYFMNECNLMFGIKNVVDVKKLNQKYYDELRDLKRNPQASNIFFTNGSTDPWQYLSISKERGNNENPLMDYMTIENAAHCDDLHISSNSKIIQAQKHFESLVNKWIAQ